MAEHRTATPAGDCVHRVPDERLGDACLCRDERHHRGNRSRDAPAGARAPRRLHARDHRTTGRRRHGLTVARAVATSSRSPDRSRSRDGAARWQDSPGARPARRAAVPPVRRVDGYRGTLSRRTLRARDDSLGFGVACPGGTAHGDCRRRPAGFRAASRDAARVEPGSCDHPAPCRDGRAGPDRQRRDGVGISPARSQPRARFRRGR